MIRDWRLLLPPLAIIMFLAISFTIFRMNYSPESKPIPGPEQIEPGPEQTAPVEPTWYIRFTVANQKSTYYTESAQAPASASARGYFIGSGAVHPRYPLNAGGEARQPIIPFGTRLYLSEPIVVQGQELTSIVVNDTGDVYYGLWRKYPYWVDVYSGQTNYYTNLAAGKAGVDLISYHWYQPWQ